MAKKLIPKFKYFLLQKIGREGNTEADKLAKIGSGDILGNEFVDVEVRTSSILTRPIYTIDISTGTWVDEITRYIESGALLEDIVKARQMRRQFARYILHNNILYGRSFSRPRLQCVPPNMTTTVLDELHEGVCNGHLWARILSKRVINQGYY